MGVSMELYVYVGFFTKQIFAQRDCVAIKARSLKRGGGYGRGREWGYLNSTTCKYAQTN